MIQRPTTTNLEVSDETMPRGQASSRPGCSGLVSVLPDTRVSRSSVIDKKSRSFEPGEVAHLPSWDARQTGRSADGRRSPREIGNDHAAWSPTDSPGTRPRRGLPQARAYPWVGMGSSGRRFPGTVTSVVLVFCPP